MKHNTTPFPSLPHTRFVPLCTLLLSLAVARAETVEKIDRTFDAKPGGQLVVDVDFGAIEVTTHASDQVAIHVTRSVSRGAKADEEAFLQDRLTLSQDGDTVSIQSKATTKNSGSWKGRQRTEGKYTIVLPAKFNIRLKTAGGEIEVRDVQGEQKLNTSGGNIEVVGGGGGALNGHTSGGSVAVKSFRGPVLVDTSGGNVRLEDVAGEVAGSTSGGSVSASLASVSEPVKLTTSGGNVTLRVPADAAFDLDASTAGGSAGSELPVTVTGKRSGSHLKGPVNGGGKSVVLRSSGGNVWVKKI